MKNPSVKPDLSIAVASNFVDSLQVIATAFTKETGLHLLLIPGSTGKHYAQIRSGAPFDVFLAADSAHPQRLVEEGIAIVDSRFTYALGKLVLWSSDKRLVDPEGMVLQQGRFLHLALANPNLAPYGKAAQELLQNQGLWKTLQNKLVRGENVSQAFQYVRSGNAELGFVAWSQVSFGTAAGGSWWIVPQKLYSPIAQQAVLLQDSEPARTFLRYLGGEDARKIIRDHGYDTP